MLPAKPIVKLTKILIMPSYVMIGKTMTYLVNLINGPKFWLMLLMEELLGC